MPLLYVAVVFACGICLLALMAMILGTGRFPPATTFARRQGSVRRGIMYAFGTGMTPWEKESARRHLPTYFAGVTYHLGIFAALLLLALRVLGIMPPFPVAPGLAYISASGAICGVGLLVKRIVSSRLRGISVPDDYLANLLVDAFLLCA
ncbi:MAG TPA: hypothetical protein ENN69_06925, partial [Spirochaetia bacterium]|nr:hypothetical protein [Spirochaetia bacterium]